MHSSEDVDCGERKTFSSRPALKCDDFDVAETYRSCAIHLPEYRTRMGVAAFRRSRCHWPRQAVGVEAILAYYVGIICSYRNRGRVRDLKSYGD